MYRYISNYLENFEYFRKKQYGFRKGHSTLDGIVNFTGDIFDSINKGKYTVAAFIYLKRHLTLIIIIIYIIEKIKLCWDKK